MISPKELDRFKTAALKYSPWFSLYLDTSGAGISSKALRVKAKDLLKKTQKEQPRGGNQQIQEFLKSLQSSVIDGFDRQGAKGICLFSSPEGESPFLFRLPLPVPDMVRLGSRPRLHPFLPMVESARAVLLVVVGKGKARLYRSFFGRLQEGDRIDEELPAKVREGGWQGYRERKIDRHVDDHVNRFVNSLGETIASNVRRYPPDYIVLLGSRELFPLVKEVLKNVVPDDRIINRSFSTEPSWEEMIVLSQEVEDQIQDRERSILQDRLTDQMAAGTAIAGLSAVLRALFTNQVETLVVAGVPPIEGIRCPECGFVGLEGSVCPMCRSEIVSIDDLHDQAVFMALEKGCRLFYFPGDSFRDHQGAVALLRYPV